MNERQKDELYDELVKLIGKDILVITKADQLNIFGETFRPIFAGPVTEVDHGHITIFPITIKMINAPFFKFPTPLSIPLEKISHFTTEFSPDTRFPLF